MIKPWAVYPDRTAEILMTRAPVNSFRLLIELIAIVAFAETGVMFLLPVVAPGVEGTSVAILDALVLSLLIGPLMLWRVLAALGRLERGEGTAKHKVSRIFKVGLMAVIVSGMGLSIFSKHHLQASIEREARGRFESLAADAVGKVERRVMQPVYGLKGARGVYAASKAVERNEFKAYVESRDLAMEFPGALGMGFIQRVMREDVGAFLAAERADDAPDFQISIASIPQSMQPQGGPAIELQPDLYIIKHIYPLERNRPAWGFDVGSEPVRREAVERAVATGEPAITGKIRLVQDSRGCTGFLYFVPVYKNGSHPKTAEERFASLVGLTYSPIVMEDALVDLNESMAGLLDVEVFDGTIPESGNKLFDLDDHLAGVHGVLGKDAFAGKKFHTTASITMGGRPWTVTVNSTPKFDKEVDETTPTVAMVAGLVVTFLTTAALWSMGTSRARALALADAMTRELRETTTQSQRLAEIAQRTSNGVVVTDRVGKIEWINEGFTRMTGFSLEEVLGRTPGSLLQGPDTDAAEVARIKKSLALLQPVQAELVNYSKEGRRYIVAMEIVPLSNAGGEHVGFMAIETDVTERREAQTQIESRENRLRMLVDAADVVMWEYDIGEERFTYVSPQAKRYGYPMEEWLTAGFWADHLHPEDREQAVAFGQAETMAGRDHRMTYRFMAADGGVVWVEDVVRVQARNGSDPILRGVLIDITEKMKTQEILRNAQATAEAASRTKSEFLANMSHEIRTPLTAILGFTELLREDGNLETDSKRRAEAIDTIKNAGNHLLTVINDILDLSKIEANRMTLERVSTPVCRILQEVSSLMRPRATEKGLFLRTTLETAVPEAMVGDPTRLRQIILNLLGNAVKFTEKGSVTLTARVATSEHGQRLQIDIDDTGPGLTGEQAQNLFSPFTQADSSVTRKHGGTGLGLTICRRLAALMGGSVTLLRTREGEGSCFRVDLPLEPVAGTVWTERLEVVRGTADGQVAKVAGTLAGRILLAEDGPDNQRLISFHLRKAGAHVDVADNGKVALNLIDKATAAGQPYDLLVTDMQMPEMDGYSLARALRDRGSNLGIIALTAHAMGEDRQKCIDAGCDDYASKPIDKAALLAVCSKWIGRGDRSQSNAA